MERFLYISPAIVAIAIFIYVSRRQQERRDKLRHRIKEKQEALIAFLQTNNDTNNTDNE
jgi:hypothetical protein